MMKFLMCLLVLFYFSAVDSQRCDIDDRVKIALRGMNHQSVPRVVDCVVGQGPCDSTGAWIRSHARDGACGRRCGSNCSCREVQIRLIVRKMQSQFFSQWNRVKNHYGC